MQSEGNSNIIVFCILCTVNAKKANKSIQQTLLDFKSIPSTNCENTIQYFLR